MSTLDHDRLMAAATKSAIMAMPPQVRMWLVKLATVPHDEWSLELAKFVAHGHDIDVESELAAARPLVRDLADDRWQTDHTVRESIGELSGYTDPIVMEWYLIGAQRADVLLTGPRLRSFDPLPEGREDLPAFSDWGDALDWAHTEAAPLRGLLLRRAAVGDHELVCRLYDLMAATLGPGGRDSGDGEIHAAVGAAAQALNCASSARVTTVVCLVEAEIELAAGNPDGALRCLDAVPEIPTDVEGENAEILGEVHRVLGTAYAALEGAEEDSIDYFRRAIELGNQRTVARARLALADLIEPHLRPDLLAMALADVEGSTDRQGYHLAGEAMVSIAIHTARDGGLDEAIAAINRAGAHLGAEIGGRGRPPLTTAHRLYVECGKELAAGGVTIPARECFTVLREIYANLGMAGLPGAREITQLLKELPNA